MNRGHNLEIVSKMMKFVCPKCRAEFRSLTDLIWEPFVASIGKKKETDRLGGFGEELFSAVVTLRTGWTSIQAGGLDRGGIDRVFRLGNAIVETQIKTSSMAADGSWFFDASRGDGTFDVEFYSENPRAYLILIGLHRSRAEILESQDPLQVQKTILMIAGKKLVEHFEEKKNRKTYTISITYSRLVKNKYKWLEGTSDFVEIFADEYEKQTGKKTPT